MILTDLNILNKLTSGSKYRIEIKCDYCKNNFSRYYSQHVEISKSQSKDCCRSCIKVKNVENFLLSVNSSQIEYIKNDLLKNNYKLSGIYSIRNKISNKSYIGSSTDIIHRWKSHIREMNNGDHYCIEFNNCNINDLEFIILHIQQNDEDLIDLEYAFINLFKTHDEMNGYNIMKSKLKNNKTGKKIKPTLNLSSKSIKLNTSEVEEIKHRLIDGESQKKLAIEYGVDVATINSIKLCKTWISICPELNDKMFSVEYKDINKGEKNSSSKLTEKEVSEIKKLLSQGTQTMKSISEKYNVSRTLIGHIKRGKLWSYVK